MKAPRSLEEPTVQLSREVIQRAAREADARAREAEEAPPTFRAVEKPDTGSHLPIYVDVDEPGDATLVGDPRSDADRPTDPSDLAPPHQDPVALALSSIPRVVVSQNDIALLGLDGDAEAMLAAVDGFRTVEAILSRIALPPGRGLELLAELASRGVVEIRSSG